LYEKQRPGFESASKNSSKIYVVSGSGLIDLFPVKSLNEI